MLKLLMTAVRNWKAEDPWRHGATIAYYAIFSMPGLLIIIIWSAGAFFDQELVQREVSTQIQQFVGKSGAQSMNEIIANAKLTQKSVWTKAIGVVSLLLGATTLFLQLQKSLNSIWRVRAAPKNGLFKLLADRATSLGLILMIAFLLLITLTMSTVISVLAGWIESYMGESWLVLVRLMNFVVSMGITVLLFAVMFKVLPDVDVEWRSVWVGGITAGLLFTVGKTALGIYFGYSQPGSSFGAAGIVILIMLWVNYTCLIVFFGAHVAQVYAVHRGHPITPSRHATWLDESVEEEPHEQAALR